MAGRSTEEMVDEFRRRMDDVVEPYLWSEEAILLFLDQAQKDFARLTDCFPDSADIIYTSGTEFVPVSESYHKIRRARIVDGTHQRMAVMGFNKFEAEVLGFGVREPGYFEYGRFGPDWEDETGEPQVLLTDIKKGMGRLVPKPEAGGTLRLYVYRLPGTDIDAIDDDMEVQDRQDQMTILLRMRALAYDDHDAEAFNPDLADKFQLEFERAAEAARVRQENVQFNTSCVRYGGIP